MHNELKITDMQTLESNKKTFEESTNPISLDLPDFTTDSYKDAYSRINAIVIAVSYTHLTLPTKRIV